MESRIERVNDEQIFLAVIHQLDIRRQRCKFFMKFIRVKNFHNVARNLPSRASSNARSSERLISSGLEYCSSESISVLRPLRFVGIGRARCLVALDFVAVIICKNVITNMLNFQRNNLANQKKLASDPNSGTLIKSYNSRASSGLQIGEIPPLSRGGTSPKKENNRDDVSRKERIKSDFFQRPCVTVDSFIER